MMNGKRLFALLLAAALLLASAPIADARYEAFEHPNVPYSEMVFRGVDLDGVEAQCARFAADPLGEYEALVALFDEVYTQKALASIRMCENPADDAARAESEQADNDFSRAADAIYSALGEALAGRHGAALAALMPEGEAEGFFGYEPTDEAEFETQSEENALLQAYYALPYDDACAPRAAELYLRLLELRRREAERAGYDSFADYAYRALFSRSS